MPPGRRSYSSHMSQTSQDEAQTLIDADATSKKTVTENLASDDSLPVDAGTEKSAKIADENAELDDVEFDDRQTIITDKNKD